MAKKTKVTFGSVDRIDAALNEGKINEYDLMCLEGGKFGWIDKNGKKVFVEGEQYVVTVDELPISNGKENVIYIYNNIGYVWNGTECVPLTQSVDVSSLQASIENLKDEIATKVDTEVINAELNTINADVEELVEDMKACENSHEKVKYEITDVPVGTLVKINENEIRVMCPADSVWTKQSVGSGGDPNCNYCTFKTYVPSDKAVGYIEHLNGQVDSEILTDLKNDSYGRKYQPTWLALAKYDETTDTWSYYGANSSENHYIGYDYQIDWFDAEGKMIASDSIRINLSNEDCHYFIEPYYVGSMMAEVDTKIKEKLAGLESAWEIVEF